MERPILTFDCYGTLIDWEAGMGEAFEREAARAGRRLERPRLLAAYAECEAETEAGPYRPYREVLAESARCAAARLGWELSPEEGSFLAESLPSWGPFPDVNPALERLSGAYRLAILSNVDDDLLAATRRHLSAAWDLIVTAEQVRSYKPRHAHWIEARRRMKGSDAKWTHVAQSYYHDVQPALELGLPVVWVDRRGERLQAGQRPPTREVSTLEEAADFLLEAT